MEYNISRTKHKNADFKDAELERKFLGGLLNNEEAFKKIVNEFNSEWFTNNRLKRIYDSLVEYYLQEDEMIRHISLLKSMDISKDKKKYYNVLWKKIDKLGKKNNRLDFLLATKNQLKQLYDARIIEIGARDTLRSLNGAMRGNFKEIKNASNVIRGVSDILEREHVATIAVDPVDNFVVWKEQQRYYQKHPEESIGVPTGIVPIDKVITGLRKSEFGLCIADTGVGKSIFLLDVAVFCWLMYGDVLYVTIEMPADQLQSRFWCNVTQIPYTYFRKLALTKKHYRELERRAKRYQGHENKFIIVDMPKGCSVPAIATEVDKYVKRRKGKLKLVVVDYMNIISGVKGVVDLNWETQVGIAMNLKQQVARRFELPVWSGCQVTGDKVAFAGHIKDNIDIGIKFEADPTTIDTGLMDVTYPKARDFKGKGHNIKTDRDLMTMYKDDNKRGKLRQVRTGPKLIRK